MNNLLSPKNRREQIHFSLVKGNIKKFLGSGNLVFAYSYDMII